MHCTSLQGNYQPPPASKKLLAIAKNDIKKYFKLNCRILLKNESDQLEYTSKKNTSFTFQKTI